MSLLASLIKITQEYDPTQPEYHAAATAYFADLVAVANAAQQARGELNRQIPHSKRTFNALQVLREVDRVDSWPFRHSYHTKQAVDSVSPPKSGGD